MLRGARIAFRPAALLKWDGYSGTSDVSQTQHGYDYAGNRTYREDVLAATNSKNHDEFYTYDGLQRLGMGVNS